jgi:very-short-patch-repair endonuclease
MSERSKALRANSSPIERRMWRLLFTFRADGYHFRKQEPIGPYVVDMACHHASLVIEVDGDTHYTDTARRRDAIRDAFLSSEGYTVLRFTNLDVVRNPEGVFDVVARTLAGRPRNRRAARPLPNPPHEGEGVSSSIGHDPAQPPAHTSPLVGEAGRGEGSLGPARSLQVRRAARPLPNPPHKGEGVSSSIGHNPAQSPADTSPLVGEAGRGDCDA